MRFGWSAVETSFRIRGIAKIAAIILFVIYAAIYMWAPFSELWNAILTDLLLVIAAAFAATIATLIWTYYEEGEPPNLIWRYFAVGLWLWVIAETIWGYLNVTSLDTTGGEVPEGIADVFWVAAYIFFAYALWIQYRILAQPNKGDMLPRVLLAVAGLLAAYILVYHVLTTGAEAQSGFGAAVNSFYPVGDLFLGAVAVWLVRHFSGGVFARPWLGLLAFSVTDLLYAWIEISGLYAWTVSQSNWLSSLFDMTYLGAYLVLGLGILSQWAFLKYGLRSPE